ncbi:MAG: YggS family pyridoxal phosphate-dependent enzyme [Gammaproteobacteria bacterium]|nr:YggS family pyridoxal phosphate-dependent enzyme [Gammaproteobacteria bacterium]
MIPRNVNVVLQRIRAAEKRFNRSPGSVNLLAVSKKCSIEQIIGAYQMGLIRFAESYLQEAEAKMIRLADYGIEWHFIGPIQSNKTSGIAERFDWVHSVDRLKIAQRLSEQRPPQLGNLNVCIQVNVSSENTKSGVALNELPALAESVSQLPNIELRGLMAIPAPSADFERQRLPYHLLYEALQCVKTLGLETLGQKKVGHNWDTLSMGMSNDLEAAISEGSTFVRVGRAIFGNRIT